MAAGLCELCGKPRNRCVSTARFCLPCAQERNKTRIATRPHANAGALVSVRNEAGEIICADCEKVIPRNRTRSGGYVRTGLRCWDCNRQHYAYMAVATGKQLANYAVHRAIASGVLKPASAHTCVDCGAKALAWDHRDYNRPLDVEPVCQSCNSVRGKAIPFNGLLVGLLLLGAASQV